MAEKKHEQHEQHPPHRGPGVRQHAPEPSAEEAKVAREAQERAEQERQRRDDAAVIPPAAAAVGQADPSAVKLGPHISAKDLLGTLRASGTGEGKIRIAEDHLRENPDCSAKDLVENCLKPEPRVGEGTVAKAEAVLRGEKPAELVQLEAAKK